MTDVQTGSLRPDRIDFDAALRAGVDHFNAREFWHAHEAWEEIWIDATADLRRFLQGLIQLAAAYHHVQRGTFSGGLRLFDAALQKLKPFPMEWCGIDRTALEAAAGRHREWVQGVIDRGDGGERLDVTEFPRINVDA